MSEATYDPTTHFLMTQREWDEETRIRDGLGEEVNRLAAELKDRGKHLAMTNEENRRLTNELSVASGRLADLGASNASLIRKLAEAQNKLGELELLRLTAAVDAYVAAGKGETDEATAGTDRRCCETVNRINDELRRIGILHPLGVAGVRDLAAMASGRLEDLKTLQAQRDKVLALCDEADREQNCPNSGNHNGDIIEDSFICWQCNGTGRLDGAECVETKDLRAVYADSRAGQAGGEVA